MGFSPINKEIKPLNCNENHVIFPLKYLEDFNGFGFIVGKPFFISFSTTSFEYSEHIISLADLVGWTRTRPSRNMVLQKKSPTGL